MGWVGRRKNRPFHTALNGQPLYLQLRDLLAERIAAQLWQVGQALPNEVLLSQEFNVSVGTIRKAMDALAAEGFIHRHQGRGTFIADRQTPVFHGLFDRLRDRNGNYIAWADPEVTVGTAIASPGEREALALADGSDEVIRFRRLRSSQDRPIVLEQSAVPLSRFAGRPDLLEHGADLTLLAHVFKVMLSRAEVRLTVANADACVAAALRVLEGTSVQKFDRIVFDTANVPVETSEVWCALGDAHYSCVHGLPDALAS